MYLPSWICDCGNGVLARGDLQDQGSRSGNSYLSRTSMIVRESLTNFDLEVVFSLPVVF